MISVVSAILTGVFCVLFTWVVGVLAEALSMRLLLILSFISGFCGNLFSQIILKGRKT